MENAPESPSPSSSPTADELHQFPAGVESDPDPLHFRLPAPATTLPFRVRTIGHIQDNPNHSTLGTYFNDAMLLIILAGQGRYQLGSESCVLHRGLVGIILPGQDAGLMMANPENPYEHLLCRFAGGEAMKTATRIIQAHGDERYFKRFFQYAGYEEVAQVLRRGIELWPGREGIRPGQHDRLRRVDAVLAETLACLDNPGTKAHQQLSAQSLWEYMYVYISRPVNLDHTAAAFGVSKQHLCKVARQVLGSSLGESWTSLKIEWAKSLLKHPNMSIAMVARKVGYEDPLYFSRVFRTRVGVSPRQWRTQQDDVAMSEVSSKSKA